MNYYAEASWRTSFNDISILLYCLNSEAYQVRITVRPCENGLRNLVYKITSENVLGSNLKPLLFSVIQSTPNIIQQVPKHVYDAINALLRAMLEPTGDVAMICKSRYNISTPGETPRARTRLALSILSRRRVGDMLQR